MLLVSYRTHIFTFLEDAFTRDSVVDFSALAVRLAIFILPLIKILILLKLPSENQQVILVKTFENYVSEVGCFFEGAAISVAAVFVLAIVNSRCVIVDVGDFDIILGFDTLIDLCLKLDRNLRQIKRLELFPLVK